MTQSTEVARVLALEFEMQGERSAQKAQGWMGR